ncbi:PEDO-3 family subclass B1 metallo-beta-lactamase [Pedobacter mucosus]|uniref:PEDO-3 family subclass B1 metallo-beta-lactamase n=1 Tax=Pedobacter mucosus TaxID=2895286 RepID=UPI001EE42657|nr:PEDO-3 family subclass B1 metallo-beta-lactamase [Pedobacter mucosus]UKT64988.1 PEDO-3 family subclass B1 metallo-beta-lactamase [Pedobacter mucosus]
MRLLYIILLSLTTVCSYGQNPKLKIKHLKGELYIYTSYSKYKGVLTDANAMYLVTDRGVVVIDAPWDSTQFQPFLDTIATRHHQKVVLAIATHSHSDRAGGLRFFKSKGIQTYASKMTNEILAASKKPQAEFTFTADTTFTVGQYKIDTYYAGEGHTKDNLVIWFPKDKVLFGGCLVKSTEAKDLGNISEANLTQWPRSIQRLKYKYPISSSVITGHQAWGNRESLEYTQKLIKK